jgi:hypothetical protein
MTRLAAQGHNLFRHLQHLLHSFEFVVRNMHSKCDLVCQFRKVLLRLSQLSFTFTLHESLSPSVEQFIPEMNTKVPTFSSNP